MLFVDDTAWPLLVTEVRGVVSDSDVDYLEQQNDRALTRGGQFISLVDVTRLDTVPSAVQRRRYAAWRKRNEDALRERVVAVAFVTGNRPLVRGALTALSWLARHPSPERAFEDRTDATAWLYSTLARAQSNTG